MQLLSIPFKLLAIFIYDIIRDRYSKKKTEKYLEEQRKRYCKKGNVK